MRTDENGAGKRRPQLSSVNEITFEVKLWNDQQPLDKTIVAESACIKPDQSQR